MHISLTGNKQGIYIDQTNNNAIINFQKAENINSINMSGVNNLVIHRQEDGTFRIVQAGGYTYDRGLFVDMY